MKDATDEDTETDLEEEEQDVLAGARALGEAKEYRRASALLEECKSGRGKFMRWYFDFLVRPYLNNMCERAFDRDGRQRRSER